MNAQAEINLGEASIADLLAQPAGQLPEDKWPVRLAEIVDGLVALYCRRGRARDEAINEAQAVALYLANDQGGRPLYLPRGERLTIALRNREIYHRHNGRNGEELADEYDMTLRQIQSIIAEQYHLQVRRRQGNLFQPEGEVK